MNPTFAGFLSFVRNQAGIPATALPDDSAYLVWCYNIAVETTNSTLPGTIYTLALYNLATSNLLNFAADVPGSTFFANLRRKLNLDGPVLGPVTSTSDEGTSVSVVAPDFFSQLSLEELGQLRDPFGRRYLALAQKAGSIWGLNGDVGGHRASLYVPPPPQVLVLFAAPASVALVGIRAVLIRYATPVANVLQALSAPTALTTGQVSSTRTTAQRFVLAAASAKISVSGSAAGANRTTVNSTIIGVSTAAMVVTVGSATLRKSLAMVAAPAAAVVAPKSATFARTILMIAARSTVAATAGSATLTRAASTSAPGGGANNTADHSDPNNAYLQALMAA